MKRVSEKPQDSDLVGEWEVDSFSYNLIKERYKWKGEKVELILNQAGKFEAINFPDFVVSGSGYPINGKLLNASGNWSIESENNSWILDMNFAKGELYETAWVTHFDLSIKNSELVLWTFIGDPDQGDRLMFKKK